MTGDERRRAGLAAIVICALIGAGAGYFAYAAHRDDRTSSGSPDQSAPGGSIAPIDSSSPVLDDPRLVFVDATPGPTYGRVAVVPATDPSGPRAASDVQCLRVYAAGDHLLCLRTTGNLVGQYVAVLLDDHLQEIKTIPVAGLPSRARISADGRIASWTVFVSGDSYSGGNFSTRTSILDIGTGELVGSLEDFAITLDGKPYDNVDVNYWGVTVADDDNTFYATLKTGRSTYLVKGDIRERTVTTLRTNVECPSLSPDGTRIAFKKRVSGDDGRNPWRLYVLDLATMHETALAETRSVDDQAAWLDNERIAYALPREGISSYDTWFVAADGTGSPQVLIEHATSPAAVGVASTDGEVGAKP